MVDCFTEPGRRKVHADAENRILWVAGPANAARTAFAAKAQRRLEALGRSSFVLDEAVLRSSLSSDLGDGGAARADHVRRSREVATLRPIAGVHVQAALEVTRAEELSGRRRDEGYLDIGRGTREDR